MLEDQIREDREGGDEFKICFVLFVLGALLCPTMKLFVRRYFPHILEDTVTIKKMNWVELVLSYLVHDIEEFKSNMLDLHVRFTTLTQDRCVVDIEHI